MTKIAICKVKHLAYNLPLNTCSTKAELLLLKLIHLFAREVLLIKKLGIEETKTT
jgi:hypothetical protein